MKTLSIILLTALAFTAFIGVAYVVRINQDDDPLAANKVELQKVRILKDIESLRLSQERERQASAKLAAKLAKEKAEQERQATIQAAAIVVNSRTLAAAVWPVLPLFLLASGMTGAGLFYFFRRVPVETPFVKASLPVRRAAAIVEKSLTVSNAAEMAKAYAFQEEISQKRLETDARVIHSLRPGRETFNISNQSALPAASEQPAQAGNMPTFQEIFDSREIHGDLILGFDDDAPRLGKYEAVHSCLIYGLARSGKTSWLRGLIGQTILTEPETRCDVLDPHAARKDSLLGSLPKTKHFHAIDAGDPLSALEEFGAELRRRLLSEEADFPPRILLIDELPALSRKPYAKQLQALCETTSQEGRKVNVFLLATAQDLRQKKIGDFRESLSSAYFFKGKPNQVGLFLDDPDAEKLYRKNVNRHGVALFSAADEEPRLVSIPECKPNDLKRLELAENIQADALPVTPQTTNTENLSEAIETTTAQKTGVVLPFRRMKRDETPMERQTTAETENTHETPEPMSDDEIRAEMLLKLETPGASLSGLAAEIGINKGGLHRFLKENQTPSENLRTALASFLGVSTMKQEA